MTKDKNIKKEKKAIKINKKTKTKRIKINLLNILIILLAFSLLFSLIFKNKESLKNIFTKTNRQKGKQTYSANDLKIGDIVYYTHKIAADKNNEKYQKVTIEKGTAAKPGYGGKDDRAAPQTFDAKNYNTTWRVWDKLPDGRIMLVSNSPVAKFDTGYGIGHIWWEHNAHKICSIFGYGYGADTNATKDFPYKVGSGIDNAPDMTDGDKGNWKILEAPAENKTRDKDKIYASGSRSLTMPDIETKLGITEEKIKNGTNGIQNNQNKNVNLGGPYYGNSITTSMTYVVQRDMEDKSTRQEWADKTKAKAKNKNYTMTDKSYWWERSDIAKLSDKDKNISKYEDMLFNNINNWTGIATNALDVSDAGSNVNFRMGFVDSFSLGSASFYFVNSYDASWYERELSSFFRVTTFLKPNIQYYKDPDPNKKNEWDIVKPKVENKKVEIGNYQNLGFEPKMNLVQNAVKTPLTKENNKYVKNIEVKSGQERKGSGDTATFVDLTSNTKYTIEVENMPNGYTFEIEGKTNKEIDIKDKTSYTLIFKKDNKEIPTRPANANELNIGDVVYYNHKITKKEKTNPEDINEYIPVEDKNLTVKLPNGSAKYPGTGYGNEQTYTAKDKKTVWRVWDINKTTGEVTLISETLPKFDRKAAIGYIWEEYNMHKVASTFGHGYGANKNTSFTKTTSRNQNFTYKVGSGLENTGDTAHWKIGEEPGDIEKINKSGTRALTLDDVEEKLNITDETIKNKTTSSYVDSNYGKIMSINIYFPQREVEGLTQNWEDKTIAKAAKQDVKAKNRYYYWYKNDMPDSIHKELMWKKNRYYELATTTLKTNSFNVRFGRAYVDYDRLFSMGSNSVDVSYSGGWHDSYTPQCVRFVTFLESNISYFKAPGEYNAWDILKLEAKEKNLELKATNLTKDTENIAYNLKSDLPASQGRSDPAAETLAVPSKQTTTKNTSVNIYSGQIRKGKLIDAEFIPVHNKYKVEITGLPANSTYKIIGADSNGYIDLSKVSSIEAIIYPKAGDYTVPIEYSGGENDDTFSVSGNLKLMNGNTVVKSQTVELKKGASNITFADIDMFNNTTNELNEYEVVFEKTDGRHKVEAKSGKVTVTYVPEEMEINISAKSDGPITLDNITVNLVKKIGKNISKEEITLENASGFTKKITVPKTNNSGNKISYSLEKKSLNMGYITTISGYDVNLKAVLALPFTGSKAHLKILVVILGISTLIGIVFRHRKKMNYIPNGIIK